jgi:hypothetical protein
MWQPNDKDLMLCFLDEVTAEIRASIKVKIEKHVDEYLKSIREMILVEAMNKFNGLRVDFAKAQDRFGIQITLKVEE